MNVSKLDREVWDEFHADWEGLLVECGLLLERWKGAKNSKPETLAADVADQFNGETRSVLTKQRIGQQFFRNSVLAGYKNRCCVSGLDVTSLLIASHIVPWSEDKSNRLNSSNGLCLSALYDRAFDQGLITLDKSWRVLVSGGLKSRAGAAIQANFFAIDGQKIELPERFMPNSIFMEWHRDTVYLG